MHRYQFVWEKSCKAIEALASHLFAWCDQQVNCTFQWRFAQRYLLRHLLASNCICYTQRMHTNLCHGITNYMLRIADCLHQKNKYIISSTTIHAWENAELSNSNKLKRILCGIIFSLVYNLNRMICLWSHINFRFFLSLRLLFSRRHFQH